MLVIACSILDEQFARHLVLWSIVLALVFSTGLGIFFILYQKVDWPAPQAKPKKRKEPHYGLKRKDIVNIVAKCGPQILKDMVIE